MKPFITCCGLLLLSLGLVAGQPFVIEPYLQMGDAPQLSSSDSMLLMWHAADSGEAWDVQVKKPADKKWSAPFSATSTRVAVRGIEPHHVFRAQLKNLTPGE